ncbi:MAG TPA: hypothetical protein DEQ14_01095 [Treponema sp.]|nr:hypothetical protein [Treponema sp.]
MLNKNWSSLNTESNSKKLKKGQLAEYYAEMQLILYGFETYKSAIDDRGIDLIIRNSHGVFFEIQVKSITAYENIFIKRNKFDTKNDRLYLLAVQFVEDEKDPEMYIIPSTRWTNHDNIFYDSGLENNEPQFGLRLTNKENCDSLQEYKLENYIERIINIKR